MGVKLILTGRHRAYRRGIPPPIFISWIMFTHQDVYAVKNIAHRMKELETGQNVLLEILLHIKPNEIDGAFKTLNDAMATIQQLRRYLREQEEEIMNVNLS